MRLRGWLTQRSSAKQDLELFTNSEWQQDQIKIAAQSLKGEGFTLLMESLKYQLKKQWEKAKSPEEREALHGELLGVVKLQARIRGLVAELDR